MVTDQKGALLTPEERTVCQQIRTANEAPHNQRAQVLLDLDEGVSQVKAAELAGLTLGGKTWKQ